MNDDLLAELKAAARKQTAFTERELIAEGPTTWFSGPAASAPDGTIALGYGDGKIIINESDIRGIEKNGDQFRVGVSADAHVLLRVDKLLKATPTEERPDDCGCGGEGKGETQTIAREKKPPIVIEIGPITVCKHICGWFYLGAIRVWVCVDVDCHVETKRQ
jgi:hypothetical protein